MLPIQPPIFILINLILQQYFNNQRCLLIFTDTDFDYIGNLPSVKISTQNSLNSKLIFNYYGCQGILILAANAMEIFVHFEKAIKQHLERFNNRRYLIVANSQENEFFKLQDLDFVSDILIVLPRTVDINIIFELQTHKYVGFNSSRDILLVDKWYSQNNSFLFGSNLYPDKISNQLGRILKMGTFTYPPYSIIESGKYHGSELMAAVEFAKHYNMTAEFLEVNDYWGEIFDNGTGYGLLGALLDDKADIGFAALYTWEFCYHHLDLSKPLVRTGITCLVPAPKPAARWLTPLFSYSKTLWFSVIAVLLASVVILSYIFYFYNIKFKTRSPKEKYEYDQFIKMSTTVVIKPVLLQSLSTSEVPVERASIFMMALMLILSLFLTSTYSSGLATVMTLPRYEDAINSIPVFAKSDLKWGANADAWILSLKNYKDPDYVKVVEKFQVLSEDKLRFLSKTDKFAFSIERLPFENFAIGDYIKEDVIGNYHLMQKDFYWEQCVIMLRKNSILLPVIDLFVLRIFESGLISKWQTEAVNLYMNAEVQRVVRYLKNHNKHQQEVVKLKWSHVEGAFAILIAGFCISFAVFVAEKLSKKLSL